jgi:galactokinase
MPAAIGFYIWVAISPRDDRKLTLHSKNFPDNLEVELDERNPKPRRQWSDYVQGVAVMLERARQHLRGANLLVRGDVPIGAGLSSSAAIGVASALALLENSEAHVSRTEVAQVCQRSENEFVGAHVGIMDPFVACFGREGKALMLDCRSLDFRLLAVPEGISLVICNTMVKHSHAAGGYNKRREECDEGVRLLKRGLPKIRSLRDVRLEELYGHRARLPVLIYRRCRHVIAENARVLAAADALTHGDLIRFGNLMAESHKSLRDDFEVSCRELDLMVEIAASQKGVYGARMTGGGFGGCTINTVANADVNEFRESVARVYEEETGLAPEIFVSNAAEGATEVTT